MSRIMYRALALLMVLAGTVLAPLGLSMAYGAMTTADAWALAITLAFITAPGVVLVIGGVVVWLDTEPADEPADGHADDWHCWCESCRRHRTGTLRTDR